MKNLVPSSLFSLWPFHRLKFSANYLTQGMVSIFLKSTARLLASKGFEQMCRFFNGDLFSFKGINLLRLQLKILLSLSLNYNSLRLPNTCSNVRFRLIRTKFICTVSKSVFCLPLYHYVDQINKFRFNPMINWHFAPLSNWFIFYNDHYIVNRFEPR